MDSVVQIVNANVPRATEELTAQKNCVQLEPRGGTKHHHQTLLMLLSNAQMLAFATTIPVFVTATKVSLETGAEDQNVRVIVMAVVFVSH
jgi:hypothetical protein